ncbi:crossover junction endonuclease eme1 [Rhizoclosmatium hyalinum]|nr:crossover junction endonuclease eme1 [Rhizoclosmatium hyalinum]
MSVHVDPAFVTALPGGAKILDAIQEAGAKLKMVPQPIHSAIEWSRNVTREFDIAGDKWIPCEPRTEREPYLLVRLSASEFSKLVLRPGGDGVQSYIANIRRQFGSKSKLIILLEGIKELLKSRTKNISAHIQNEIRGGGGGGGGGSRQHLEPIASKEDMDAQLLWLQMFGDCFVQQAESLEETCGLIVSFTTTIAMIPERKYRSETHLRLNFGDEVKKGDSIQDHWRKILMEVKPLTEPVANSIMAVYPTYRSLMEAYAECPSQSARESVLEDILIDRGTVKRDRVGPSRSRKICWALTVDDPTLAVFDPPPPKKQYNAGGAAVNGNGGGGGGGAPFQRAGSFGRGGGGAGFRGGSRGRGRGGGFGGGGFPF